MANTFRDINRALEKRLNSMSGLPPVAWPNTDYDPTLETEYLRATLLPAASEQAGYDGKDRHQGIFQVDVFEPIHKGTKDALNMADSIRDHFKDQTLTENSRKIYIMNINLIPAERVESWYMIGVEINYLAIED